MKTKKDEFIQKHGYEEIKTEQSFPLKTLAANYTVPHAINEFCDNAYDARIEGSELKVEIKFDEKEHTLIVHDNGTGVVDLNYLVKLGLSEKQSKKDKLGKFGIGFMGASAAIAKKCVYDNNECVECIIKTAHEGLISEKHLLYDLQSQEIVIGNTINVEKTDISLHFTEIMFNNVFLKRKKDIINKLNETYEETFNRGLSIKFNKEELGGTIEKFNGEKKRMQVKVGDFDVEVEHYTFKNEKKRSEKRKTELSGIGIYDKVSGRLLSKSTEYWRLFAGLNCQPNICGLRVKLFIDSSFGSYELFGISTSKNGITSRNYSKDEAFEGLKSILSDIYRKNASSALTKNPEDITIGGYVFIAQDRMYVPYQNGGMKNGKVVINYPKNLKRKDYCEVTYEKMELQKEKMELQKAVEEYKKAYGKLQV